MTTKCGFRVLSPPFRGMLRHGARRLSAVATRGVAPPAFAAARAHQGWSPSPPVGWRAVNTWTPSRAPSSPCSASTRGLATAFRNRPPRSRAFASETDEARETSRRDLARAAASRAARAARVASSTAEARGNAATGGVYLVALTVAMVGATYASVPLYRMFCQATGFGGTVRRKTLEETLRDSENASPATKRACEDREVTISFNADVAEGVPWKFAPTQKRVRVKPGETALAFFTAKNMSTLPVVGVATYNVQPNKAGSYFNKVQCFCFEEQRLRAGEEVDMPVFFYLDPEFAADPAMADVNDVVLSYTFFRSDGFDETDEYAKQTGARTHGPGEAGLPEGIKTHAGLAK